MLQEIEGGMCVRFRCPLAVLLGVMDGQYHRALKRRSVAPQDKLFESSLRSYSARVY